MRQGAPPAPRGRSHSLAPEHLGEAASVAMLVCAVGGAAIFIAAIAMVVAGLTIGSSYTGTAPPNLGALGTPQIIGGAGLVLLGGGLIVAAMALLGDLRFGRPAATVLTALTAVLAAAGAAMLVGEPGRDTVLVVALAVAFVIFGAATVVLVRANR